MAFPSSLKPTSRQYSPGDYPVKTYNANNGAEVRILYGSRPRNMTLELSYSNITDSEANDFLTHYYEMQGTYQTFGIPSSSQTFSGWTAGADNLNLAGTGAVWRYGEPPQQQSVRPGVSTVSVRLIGVQS
jgi:hypothetical protein